jgi:hypothetical protein
MQLLDALGKNVKKSHKKGHWMAKCPVHNDKDFAMRIKENEKGGLSICCYACGANGLDVFRHLNLDIRELFGERIVRSDDYVPEKVRDIYMEDCLFMAIFRSDLKKGLHPCAEDARRMRLAVRRSRLLEGKHPALKKTVH